MRACVCSSLCVVCASVRQCVSWHRRRPVGTESAEGRPAERGKWLGCAVVWCLTGGQTVGGDDHTLRTIITQDGGHRLLLIQQWLSDRLTTVKTFHPAWIRLNLEQISTFCLFIENLKTLKTYCHHLTVTRRFQHWSWNSFRCFSWDISSSDRFHLCFYRWFHKCDVKYLLAPIRTEEHLSTHAHSFLSWNVVIKMFGFFSFLISLHGKIKCTTGCCRVEKLEGMLHLCLDV